MYLIRQGQGGECGNTFRPLDAHEKEARRRLAHGLRRHLVEVHGSAADLMGILGDVTEIIMYQFVVFDETLFRVRWKTKIKFQTSAPGFIGLIISVACGGFAVRNPIGGFVALIRDKNFNF